MYLLSKEKYDRLNKRFTSRETEALNNKSPHVALSTSRCAEYESPPSKENSTITSLKSRINPEFISKNVSGDRLCDSAGLETCVSSSDCSTLRGNEKERDQQTDNKRQDLSQNEIMCYDVGKKRAQTRKTKSPEQTEKLCMSSRKRRVDSNEKDWEHRASKKEKLDTKEGEIQESSPSPPCIAKCKRKEIYKKMGWVRL